MASPALRTTGIAVATELALGNPPTEILKTAEGAVRFDRDDPRA
jgi:hypothetical protein